MSESEIAKRITKVVKALDKLTQDLVKDTKRLREAAEELKGEKKEDGPDGVG